MRVKEKVARLRQNSVSSIKEAENDLLRVYKLEDSRNIFTLNDNEMKLKEGDFLVKVESHKSSKDIVAEYDRAKLDPYHLISELLWTIYKDGKSIYKKNGDNITYTTKDAGNYEIKLNIKYNGNNQKVASRTVRIQANQSTIDNGMISEVVVTPPVIRNDNFYFGSIYEQLFESDFKISSQGYTDMFGVVWGMDSEIQIAPNNKSYMDKSSSLIVSNKSDKYNGIWINLDRLLEVKDISDKMITIRFFGRKETEGSKLDVTARIKWNNTLSTTQSIYALDNSWERKSMQIFIPKGANGLTLSISTGPNEEFNIDGFILED
ncbi:MAG: hypothetical protein K0S61_1122 [Anaerocolumna sp.]|nr:hypothetical protein [Anaerocolumna sp.]